MDTAATLLLLHELQELLEGVEEFGSMDWAVTGSEATPEYNRDTESPKRARSIVADLIALVYA